MAVATLERPAVEPAAQKPEEAERLVIFAWSGELDRIDRKSTRLNSSH